MMLPEREANNLREAARLVRADVLRMAQRSKSAHTATALSCADILVALYFHAMKADEKAPRWEGRDRLVFSKGHGAMALYACLARRGDFPVEALDSYLCDGSGLWEHPSAGGVPGVEFATGSLGHGLSIAAGAALGLQRKKSDARAFAIVGDGEGDEGSVYEAAAFAGARRLGNLTMVIDNNGLQACGLCDEISGCIDRVKFFESLNWRVIEADGHSFESLADALSQRGAAHGAPLAVIARTVKGKGVSFMEHNLEWHYRPPSAADLEKALKELNA